jgi:thioredoxin
MVEVLNKESFKQRVHNYEFDKEKWNFKGDKPCIIDFYADWCQPCQILAPILESLANDYEGKVDIYKVNTESEQELSASFGIRSIPSLLFVPLKETPRMTAGMLDKKALEGVIKDVLKIN